MFSYKLSKHLGLGFATRFINSSISRVYFNGSAGNEANTVSIDLSMFFKSNKFILFNKKAIATAGLAITNIGGKIKYSPDQNFIPTNLRLGGGLKTEMNEFNAFGIYLDFNKLLVPTPPVYGSNTSGQRVILAGRDPNVNVLTGMIQSFYDAPGGWREELKEIQISSGMEEYLFKNVLALRTGYSYENVTKGGRQFFTFGSGLKYKVINIDASYLVPVTLRNSLQNTWRISLSFLF